MALRRPALAALLTERARLSSVEEFKPETLCFGPQLRAVESAAKRKVWCCGRRAGKTRGLAVGLLAKIREPPFSNVFYLTLTLKNAKRIIWSELKRLNDLFALGGEPNESEGYLRFPSLGADVHLYLGGVKDATEIEKLRGVSGKLYVVDEVQAMPQRVLVPLLKDVIRPALLDYQGELWLSGTPGALRAGYFWDVDQGRLANAWEHHSWTVRDNVRLPARVAGASIDAILAEILRENAWTPDDPTFRREYLGEWVEDTGALVFRLTSANHYDTLPDGGRWRYVMGVDLGFEDADALAVLGWREHERIVYLVEEATYRKSGVTELAERIGELYRKYKPHRLVADFGGLGKKIGEEIRSRHGLPMEPADKARKLEHIELLNDAFRRGHFMCRAPGPFAEDCAIVQWDQDAKARGIRKIAEDYHSDITDAVLYAYRAAMAWLETPAAAAVEPGRSALLDRLLSEQDRDDPLEALGYF